MSHLLPLRMDNPVTGISPLSALVCRASLVPVTTVGSGRYGWWLVPWVGGYNTEEGTCMAMAVWLQPSCSALLPCIKNPRQKATQCSLLRWSLWVGKTGDLHFFRTGKPAQQGPLHTEKPDFVTWWKRLPVNLRRAWRDLLSSVGDQSEERHCYLLV